MCQLIPNRDPNATASCSEAELLPGLAMNLYKKRVSPTISTFNIARSYKRRVRSVSAVLSWKIESSMAECCIICVHMYMRLLDVIAYKTPASEYLPNL
jgi:hypothetical protein